MKIVITETEETSVAPNTLIGASARGWLGSFSASVGFHALLLLLPIGWFVAKHIEPDHDVIVSVVDDELGSPQELERTDLQLELPSEPPLNLADQEVLAMYLAEANELSFDSITFDLPVSKTARNVQNSQRTRKPTRSEEKQEQITNKKSAIEKEVQKRLDKAGGKGGAIQISLLWNNGNDLDLYTKTPAGDIIAFAYKRSSCGGELDVDMNARKPETTKPVENIFWSAERAPMGTFIVGVNEYQNHRFRDPTPFLVSVKVDGKVHHFRGSTRWGLPLKCICMFKRTAEGVEFLKPPKKMPGTTSGKTIKK